MERMSDLCWRVPSAGDYELLYAAATASEAICCTDAAANIILYREKYKTQICEAAGFVLRRYGAVRETQKDISAERPLYGFPLGRGNLLEAFSLLEEDAQKFGLPKAFPLLSENDKKFFDDNFSGSYVLTERRADADYLYLTQRLADLPGRKFHKKKNHVSQFLRRHGDVEFRRLDETGKADVLLVEAEWFAANGGDGASTGIEKAIIKDALANFEALRLRGGVLYVAGRPVAFAIGCAITDKIGDVQFEKALPEFERDGAYAVVNQQFARTMTQFEYLNREEDLGIEGLRKAKLSYYPDMILSKWSAT